MTVIDERYSQREMASVIAARRIERLLSRRLRKDARAAIVVSGGTSPALCFEELRGCAIEWSRVLVVPSDERWVDANHADSNERFIRENLTSELAADAEILPLYRDATSPDAALPSIAASVADAPTPFAATLLGIGSDGHFASLFPDAANLEEGLEGDGGVVVVETAASPHPRISLTLPTLAKSAEIIVLAFGSGKREVLDAALAGDERYPVTRLLARTSPDIRIVWAP